MPEPDKPAIASLPVLKGLRIVEASAFVAAPLRGMTLVERGIVRQAAHG